MREKSRGNFRVGRAGLLRVPFSLCFTGKEHGKPNGQPNGKSHVLFAAGFLLLLVFLRGGFLGAIFPLFWGSKEPVRLRTPPWAQWSRCCARLLRDSHGAVPFRSWLGPPARCPFTVSFLGIWVPVGPSWYGMAATELVELMVLVLLVLVVLG